MNTDPAKLAPPAAALSRPARGDAFSPVFKAAARHWLAGIAICALGAGIARLLAPALIDQARLRTLITLFGELVALAGLFVIVLGIRRRLDRAAQDRPD